MSKQKFTRNAYTSQKAKRPTISLKNLFAGEMLQNNFVSLNSQKLYASSRPQTMNCDRIKQKLYEQAINDQRQKRCLQINFKTQSKLLKNKSQQFKRSSSYHNSNAVDVKQIVPIEQKIKMKKALGKINLLAQDELQITQQQQIQTIFNFLDCLSQNQHFYNNAFKYLTKKLKSQIFMQKQNLKQEQQKLVNILIQSTDNKKILQLIHGRGSQKCTFKHIINEVLKEYIAIDQKIHKINVKNNQQLKQLNRLLSQKQQTIIKLVKKVKYLEEHPSQNRYSYILDLQTKLEIANKQIQQNLYSIRVLNYNLEIMSETTMNMTNKIQKLKGQITQYEIQKQSGLQTVQKSSQLKHFESNVSLLRQMMDKSIIKMSGVKEQYQKMKTYNIELENERDKLAKRAAVGFGQLTPRPNLKKIFTTYNLDFESIFEQPKKISTQKFVQKLLEKFKNYYESHKMITQSSLQLQDNKKSIQLDGNNNSVQLNENNIKDKKDSLSTYGSITATKQLKQKSTSIADSAINDLQQTKKQIQKSVLAAEQVKIAYSKQKFKGN